MPLKKLSPGSIFHDIDAIWSPRLILSDRLSVLLPGGGNPRTVLVRAAAFAFPLEGAA